MNIAILTPTEDLICRYKCLGLQSKEIADQMHRSEGTLRVHFRHIHTKLHINNEVELVIWYIENVLKIDIKKMVQVVVLLAVMVPSILGNERTLIRTQRTARTSSASRSARSRRSESDFYLQSV